MNGGTREGVAEFANYRIEQLKRLGITDADDILAQKPLLWILVRRTGNLGIRREQGRRMARDINFRHNRNAIRCRLLRQRGEFGCGVEAAILLEPLCRMLCRPKFRGAPIPRAVRLIHAPSPHRGQPRIGLAFKTPTRPIY